MIKFPKIESIAAIDQVEALDLEHSLWNSKVQIPTTAHCAYNDDGFVIKFLVMESDPLRRFKHDQEFVFKDSAVEFFISFSQNKYFNFEVNAHGAILSEYGIPKTKPSDREYLSAKDLNEITRTVALEDSYWSVCLEIPFRIFENYEKEIDFKHFSFNLYKIAEDSSVEHYQSFALVKSETPNFHRPQDFVAGSLQ